MKKAFIIKFGDETTLIINRSDFNRDEIEFLLVTEDCVRSDIARTSITAGEFKQMAGELKPISKTKIKRTTKRNIPIR